MKKLLLSIGALAAVVAPVAAVIACSSDKDDDGTNGTKTIKSGLTADEIAEALSGVPDSNNGIEVSLINENLKITTGVNPAVLATDIKYKDGVLSFKAGSLGEEKPYSFKITPKATPAGITSNLDNIKTASITSLNNFVGLTQAAKETAIAAINTATDKAGIEAALQAATASTQPGSGIVAPDTANQGPIVHKNVTFDKDIEAYQNLGVMAYGNPIKVATKASGKTWTYKSATVFDAATAGDATLMHYMDKTNADDVTLAATLLPKVQTVFDQTLATFNKILDELKLDSTSLQELQEAGAKAVSAITALDDGTKTYEETETEIKTDLDKFLTDIPALKGLSKLETLGDITTTSAIKLSAKEASLLKTGLPMLLKLAKTVAGLKLIK